MDPVEILKSLIEIDTRNPPGNTENAVEYLEGLFSPYASRTIGENGKLNLIVEISRGKPEFLFTSHLDTVPCDDSMLTPRVENGKVYGRGSCDAKGCVAAIASAFHEFESGAGIKLAFTADEEIGGRLGLGRVMDHISPDYVIIGEPFGSDRIGVAQATVVSMNLIVHGKSGHTAIADIREGAVYKASKLIIQFVDMFSKLKGDREKYMRELERMGLEVEYRGNGDAVFNPSIIRAGVKRNVVPDKCVIEADVRFAPWIDAESVRRQFYLEDVDVFITGYLRSFGYSLDAVKHEDDRRLVEIMRRAIEAENLKPKAVVTLGVGDIRHVRSRGIPAFYLGPGGEGLHSDREFVYIDEIHRAVRIYRNIVTLSEK